MGQWGNVSMEHLPKILTFWAAMQQKKLKKYTQNYENRCFLIRDWVAEIYFWAVGRALLGSPMGDPLNNCKYLFSNKMLSDKKHIG